MGCGIYLERVAKAVIRKREYYLLRAFAIMPRACSAFGCTNRDTKELLIQAKGIKFYRIPVAKEKRRRWLGAINRRDFNPPPNACICSVHFVGGKESYSTLMECFYIYFNRFSESVINSIYQLIKCYVCM